MIDEFGGTLPARTQDPDQFDSFAEIWARWFTNTAIPGVNTAIQEQAALSSAYVYSPGTTYNQGEVVISTVNGRRYPVTASTVSGVEPSTDTSNTYYGQPYGVSVSEFYQNFPGKNKIINGAFRVNQDGVSGTVTLAYDEYGHDMFKGGSSGCTYTFTETENEVEITITSGSLVQVIAGEFLTTGTYIASWDGTAQVKIGAGAYGDSGTTSSVTGGSDLAIEIGTGTIKNLQFEIGNIVSRFEERLNEGSLCKLFYRVFETDATVVIGVGVVGSTATSAVGANTGMPLSDMIGEPVIEHSGASDFQMIRGGTTVTPSSLSLGVTQFSAGFASTYSAGDPVNLRALAGAKITASTRL